MSSVISLLTDFGVKDPFVAELKAIILSICPDAKVIDITHEVERYNIRAGAFLLASAARYFPAGTIHVGVVDPGVGSARRPILVESEHSLYVGPDNGLLIPAASNEGIRCVYELTNRSLMGKLVSSTFHGRDVFAPVAAHLASGVKTGQVGEEIKDYVTLSFNEPRFHGQGVECEVLHVDAFGNIIINISEQQMSKLSLTGKLSVRAGRRRFPLRLVRTYSDLQPKEFGILLGSHGFLEIACREYSAAIGLGVRSGNSLRVDGV
jgi:hypothetical protein